MSNYVTQEQFEKAWAEEDRRESKQEKHRFFNSVVSIFMPFFLCFILYHSYGKEFIADVTGETERVIEKQEIEQIMNDEGFKLCQYKDSLGHATIGFGHLVLPSDTFGDCITHHEAIELLVKDYKYAKKTVERRYPWAKGEAKLVLINMTFQLGENRLSKFTKTLHYMETEQYQLAAGEVLDSVVHKQAPKRIQRHSGRLLSLEETLRY